MALLDKLATKVANLLRPDVEKAFEEMKTFAKKEAKWKEEYVREVLAKHAATPKQRVYALLYQHLTIPSDRKLTVAAANTMEDAILATQKTFADVNVDIKQYYVAGQSYLDVAVTQELKDLLNGSSAPKTSAAPEVPTEMPVELKGHDYYIAQLEMASDKFATNASQKSAIRSIINNIKKHGRK